MTSRFRCSYDPTYNPPIPTLPVVVYNDDAGLRTAQLNALVDTGADGPLIPIVYLRHVQAYPIAEAFLRSHWGERRRVHLFRVDLRIADLVLPGITVVGDDQGQEIVLGRDVLNKLRLLLDGPVHEIEIQA